LSLISGCFFQTVCIWRKSLGVPHRNFGTRKFWEANAAAGYFLARRQGVRGEIV
jgi:hypothetical protein